MSDIGVLPQSSINNNNNAVPIVRGCRIWEKAIEMHAEALFFVCHGLDSHVYIVEYGGGEGVLYGWKSALSLIF